MRESSIAIVGYFMAHADIAQPRRQLDAAFMQDAAGAHFVVAPRHVRLVSTAGTARRRLADYEMTTDVGLSAHHFVKRRRDEHHFLAMA